MAGLPPRQWPWRRRGSITRCPSVNRATSYNSSPRRRHGPLPIRSRSGRGRGS